MEDPIGRIITLNDGRKAQVVEDREEDRDEDCIDCIFYGEHGCTKLDFNVLGNCTAKTRTDRKQIFYKEIK